MLLLSELQAKKQDVFEHTVYLHELSVFLGCKPAHGHLFLDFFHDSQRQLYMLNYTGGNGFL